MKFNRLFFAAAIAASLCFQSCKPKSELTPIQLEEKVLATALAREDAPTTLYALNKILALDSSRTEYLDTLARAYVTIGNYKAGAQVTDQILKLRPNDQRIIELSAIAEQYQGNFAQAIAKYNKLYELSKNVTYKYQVATVQVNAGDLKGCDSSIRFMEALPESDSAKVDIIYNNGENTETVKLKAALHYLRGYWFLVQTRNNEAFDQFRTAAEMAPEFMLVRQTMQQMLQSAARR